jgi:hypothetical protein
MNWEERIAHYETVTGFPKSLFTAGDGCVVGMWVMGNDYRVKSGYYGGYPATYLRRVAALLPDRKNVLHLFSGRTDLADMPGWTADINPELNPTYVVDAHNLDTVPLYYFDLVLCDPPYSVEDAEHYQTTMINRNKVFDALAKGMVTGSRLVWLDQVLPMYRKADWHIEARIGMVKSTNHRFRVVHIFRKR